MHRRFAFLLCLAVSARAQAGAPPILLALRAQAWPVAAALAAAEADPLASQLVEFIRLLNPGQARTGELLAFAAAHPDWPDQDVLARRIDEALADEPDARVAATLCIRHMPAAAPALLRCAEAFALTGNAGAAGAARRGWVALRAPADVESAVLARWSGVVTDAVQVARFDRLEPIDQVSALRQAQRLPPAAQAVAAARLAFDGRATDALATLTAVPAGMRGNSALLLAEARYLRRTGAIQAASALWRSTLAAAEADTVPRERRAMFWTERDALARALLASGDDAGAYSLADDNLLAPDQAVEAEFLSGWIALQRLHDTKQAQHKFVAMAAASHAAITQARAFYWLSRAQPAADGVREALARAAAWPTTYYGQLAARAGGETDAALLARIAALQDPPASQQAAIALAGSNLARAAAILVSWEDPRRAADFLYRMAAAAGTAGDRALVAQLALRLGVPDAAVQSARLAGREGVVLARSGWPQPVQPSAGPVPPALVLGLIRQESSFDPAATSAAGAHGLMQLMPATAAELARRLGAPAGPLSDPAVNMRLGTAHLGGLLIQFGGTAAYAVAAYDAGARRAHGWVAAIGDAAGATDPNAMADWIEQIPFAETRNYVQRVLENETVYRAQSGGARSGGAG